MVMFFLKLPISRLALFLRCESMPNLSSLPGVLSQSTSPLELCYGGTFLDFLPKSIVILSFTYPSFMTTLSAITAPAATTPPLSTVECLTVDPIPTNDLLWRVDPWSIAFGPTKTLSPMEISRERWALSWITQLSPMVIFLVPIRLAPYQMELFKPSSTFPITVALGATKSAASR